jgi:hypothetical protein
VHAGVAPRQLTQLFGSGERAETVEQPLDEVDLGLREWCVEEDAPRHDAVAARRLDHVAP